MPRSPGRCCWGHRWLSAFGPHRWAGDGGGGNDSARRLQPLELTKAALASGDLSVIESSGAFAEINYFAFVCLTTVGFGDINPALPLARMLSVVTSIAGPLYLAVVMGVLIGRFAGSAQSSGSSD